MKKAFTTIELIVVIAIMVIMFSGGQAVYSNIIVNSELKTKTDELTEALRLAQARALTNFNNSKWGVHLENGDTDEFTVFKGENYSARDTSWDLKTTFPQAISYSDISIAGGPDIIFTQLTGNTANSGSITVISNNGDTTTLQINSLGTIER